MTIMSAGRDDYRTSSSGWFTTWGWESPSTNFAGRWLWSSALPEPINSCGRFTRSVVYSHRPPLSTTLGGDNCSGDIHVPHTNRFVRLEGWRNAAITAGAAAVPDLIGQNPPIAAAAVVAAELAQRYEHLSDDETAVFDLLRRLAQGGSIYKVWIDQDELLAAMDPELDIEDRRRLLANMESRGLLEEGASKWRAVR